VTLKGEAKTKYQREYMRRRRAEQRAKAKPQPTPLREAASQIDPAAVTKLEARIRELETELARERKQREDAEGEMLGQRFAPKPRAASPPKAAKPPLPPDEVRDRRIKALETANRNLRQRISLDEIHYKDGLATAGGMSFKTQSLIAKVLAPDQRKHWTRTELDARLDEACKAFTSWKYDKDKARRDGKR